MVVRPSRFGLRAFSVLTLPIPKLWSVRIIADMLHSLSIDSVEAFRESSSHNSSVRVSDFVTSLTRLEEVEG